MGLVKIEVENFGGLDLKILSRTYDEKELLNDWFKLYPKSQHVILENNEQLDEMFEIFRDVTPVTDEEKEEEKAIIARLKKNGFKVR